MFQIRQCNRENCSFRFPAPEASPDDMSCPRCGASTKVVGTTGSPPEIQAPAGALPGVHVEIFLDNIRSAFNVGSMFRTADGAGIHRLHLCGITPTPDNPKTWKTALGAERSIPWTYHPNGLHAVEALKREGYLLWALEGGAGSIPLLEAVPDLVGPPLALVVGNEISGVDPGILAACDRVVHIPMQGVKRSLNVAIAFGIAAYFIRFAPTFVTHQSDRELTE